jgi:multisubunit Na+/H+ antiporter MnhC subunit
MIYIYFTIAVLHFVAFSFVIAKYARGKIEISIGLLGSAIVAAIWPIAWLSGRTLTSYL